MSINFGRGEIKKRSLILIKTSFVKEYDEEGGLRKKQNFVKILH